MGEAPKLHVWMAAIESLLGRLLRFDPGAPRDLPPGRQLRADARRELLRTDKVRHRALGGELRAGVGGAGERLQVARHARHERGWRSGRGHDAEPQAWSPTS